MPASGVTERLGVEPNRVYVRGSRHPEHDVPRSHMWGVECKTRGLTVDEQVAKVLERVAPVADQIAELRKAHPDVEAHLVVVRTFDDPDGEEEELPDGKVPGQHQLLGWHLDRDTLDFLQVTGADLDVDEYG